MNIEYKSLSKEDWVMHKEIRLEALKFAPTAFSSSYEESLAISEKGWRERSTENAIFAIADGKPVGLIYAIVNPRKKISHVANIFGFYVSNKFRGQGIGSKLMEKAIKKIKVNPDVIKINLGVISDQDSAVRLYENFGFKKVGCLSKELQINGKFFDQLAMELFFE